jgi:predicted methyltransferase
MKIKDNTTRMEELLKAVLPELWIIWEIIEQHDIPVQDVMRMLYLISNIKKISQWGRVIVTIKQGNIIAVSQGQKFVSDIAIKQAKK